MKTRKTTRTELVKYHRLQIREAEQHRQTALRAVEHADDLIRFHRKVLERLGENQ